MYEDLMALHQTDSAKDYRNDFEFISASLVDVVEEVLMLPFMNRLRKSIKVQVKLFKSMMLKDVMLKAQEVEEKNYVIDV